MPGSLLASARARLHDRRKKQGVESTVSEMISAEASEHTSEVPAGRPVCPVCWREAGEGLAPFEQLPEELKRLIAANAPEGVRQVCPRCLELFARAQAQLEKYAAVFEQG